MNISLVKGVTPRHKVFQQVCTYTDTLGPLLSHLKVANTSESEKHVLRNCLKQVNFAAFQRYRAELEQHDPGKEGTREKKERYNDSVSALRTAYNRFRLRIGTWGAE